MSLENRIAHLEIDKNELKKNNPLQFISNNKQILFVLGDNPSSYIGRICFSRYREMDLPFSFPIKNKKMKIIEEENSYTYKEYESQQNDKQEFYLNFADEHLFYAYGSDLFAQDEIMVSEMPILASLREYLLKKSKNEPEFQPRTREKNICTPCIIRNVERRVHINNLSNIYGNRFRFAEFETIQNSVVQLSIPFFTNVIAMEAPKGGRGVYSERDILFVLKTAYTGFKAAVLESEKSYCLIHTGNWGTGAFGGNKVLMSVLQLVAAKLAGVDCIVFHTFKKEYTQQYFEGKKIYQKLISKYEKSIEGMIEEIRKMKFLWGKSDGT